MLGQAQLHPESGSLHPGQISGADRAGARHLLHGAGSAGISRRRASSNRWIATVDLGAVRGLVETRLDIKGKVYGLPVEAYTVELYYNKDAVKKVGVDVPASFQLTQEQFTDLVKKGVAAGITPVSQGVGDRPFPGGLLLFESLLRKLGIEDYGKLLNGGLSFKDPRVVEVMTWMKGLVDAGAYPKSFSTLKLGESHFYFYSTPGALTFPDPSWFTGRALAPPEGGGMPANFPLGIMQFPAMNKGACPDCRRSLRRRQAS